MTTHRTPTKTIALLALAATAVAVLPGCGRRKTEAETIHTAVRRTRQLINQVEYTDSRGEGRVSVQLAIHDDFRYKSRVFRDERASYDEVVADDTLAVRVVDPNDVDGLLSPTGGDETTEIAGISSIDALKSRRWVVDETSAPFATAGFGRIADLGKDPVSDALHALDYVDSTVDEAFTIERWSKDSVNPAYTRSEDVLPKPKGGEIRYDFRRPKLPSATAAVSGAQGQLAFPATKHFRKLAVYIKNGVITRVAERVDATGKLLDDTVKYLRLALKETHAPASLRRDFDEVLRSTSGDQLGPRVFEFLNAGLKNIGQDPILVRAMSAEFAVASKLPTVDVPTTDVIHGSLAALRMSGPAKRAQASANPGGGANAGTDTTTTSTGDAGTGTGDAGTGAGTGDSSTGDSGAGDTTTTTGSG